MFDDHKKETTSASPSGGQGGPSPEEKKEVGSAGAEKPDVTGHPIMDKPTALESGRIGGAQAVPPPPPSSPPSTKPAAPVVGGDGAVEVAGPILKPRKSHRKLWFIVLIIVIALGMALGAWVFILNRTTGLGDEPSDLVDTQEPEEPAIIVPPPAPVDTDKDGLDDEEEVRLGTDPSSPDSDSDGLTDNEEVTLWNTDPLDSDTDKDGFSDGDEIDNGYNPVGAGRLFDLDDIDI